VRFAEAARQARNIRADLTALQTAGQHDPLTGLINQAALDERLAVDPNSQCTCVALVDMDGLRRINEAHSVEVGDRLIKIIARDLIDHCPSHVVARSEGGTFAILARDIDLAAAGRMVTRACEAFGARDMRVRESNDPLGHVTLSAGVVAVRGREAKAVLAAAKDQVRRAKQGGRNRVAVESIVVDIAGGADIGD
jgi:diguanylate cyclase